MGAKSCLSFPQREWVLLPAMLTGVWILENLKLARQKLVPRAKRVGVGASRPNGMILRPVF